MTDIEVDLDAHLRLATSLDKHAETMRRIADRERNQPAPVFFTEARHIASMAATGVGRVRFDGPPQGTLWYVRSITVGGLDPTIVAAGQADVYVIAGAGSVSAASFTPSLMDWRDRSTRLPNIAFYGRGELEMRAGESLTIRFFGATPEQGYAAGLRFEQYADHAGPQSWDL